MSLKRLMCFFVVKNAVPVEVPPLVPPLCHLRTTFVPGTSLAPLLLLLQFIGKVIQ